MLFANRTEAGQNLAVALEVYQGSVGVVLALPRGGVAVALPVANYLRLPLDVIITRKLGAPGNPEYAIGALCEVGEEQLNRAELNSPMVNSGYLKRALELERKEIERQVTLYRNGKPLQPVSGRVVILVDDGIATGYTVLASIRALRSLAPGWLVVAVPVAPPSTVERLAQEADRVVALQTPEPFFAVGNWYRDFGQLSDADVIEALVTARASLLRNSA